MNLNELMPTHLEDASPIDEKALDFQYSYTGERKHDDHANLHRPNVRYGLTKQIQLEAQGNFRSERRNEDEGNAGLALLYEFNKSDGYFPEFALNPMISLPTDGRTRAEPSIKLLLTSTLIGTSDTPVLQLHANINQQHKAYKNEGERRDSFSLLTGTSIRQSEKLAWVVDYWWNNEETVSVAEILEAGVHYSLGREYYFSLGFGRGLSARPVQMLTIFSLEKQI